MRNVIAIASILAGFTAHGETLRDITCKNNYWELEGLARAIRVVYEGGVTPQTCETVKKIDDFIKQRIKLYNKKYKCRFKRDWFEGKDY